MDALIVFLALSQPSTIQPIVGREFIISTPYAEITSILEECILPEGWSGWGKSNGGETTCFSYIKIRKFNQPVAFLMRVSAWNNLAEVESIIYDPLKNQIVIQGGQGEASDGYIAILKFSKGELSQRHVSSRNFPHNWQEVTNYKFTDPGDDDPNF
ncbi:hypothetical protein C0431_02570 [bacterium]|nr:hypothetical protein [bacterium]